MAITTYGDARVATQAEHDAEDLLLGEGEFAFAKDTGVLKCGPGQWSLLEPVNQSVVDALSGTYAPITASVANAHTTGILYIGHRGAPNLYPEETMEGYRAVVAGGCKAIEVDCHLLADGSVGIMHDATVDRTTTATGNTAAQTAGSWQALVVDHGATLGGAYTSLTQKAPLLDEWVREFGNKVVLVMEAKNTGSGAAIVAVLQRYGVSINAAIVCSFTSSELASARAAGYQTMMLGDALTPATVAANGDDWVGCSTSATSGYIASMTALGIKVAVYTVDRHFRRDLFAGYGATAFFSDDPIYLSGQHSIRATDPFAANTYYHGHLSSGTASTRGSFTSGKLSIPQTSFVEILQGWASPLANPNNLTLTFSVDFVTAAAPTNWVTIDLVSGDGTFPSNGVFPTGQTGYRCLFRKNGNVAVYRVTDAGSTLLETAAGTITTVTDGATATYKVTLTPTTIKAERTDVANATSAIADSTYRNLKYVYFGDDNVAARLHSVTVA